MLYGPWKESRDASGNQGEWVVELPDDKPEPMATMLNIIHSRFENLPVIGGWSNLPQLYELTVLSDKYDLAKMLRPWASSWLQPLRDKYPVGWLYIRQPEPTVVYYQQLWVAWEMGDRTLLECTIQDMMLNLQDWQFSGPEPPELLEKAQELSQIAVTTLYEVIEEAVNELLPEPGSSAQKAPNKCQVKDRSCHFTMLGSLVTSLTSCGLWPVSSGTRKDSIRSLLVALSGLILENKSGIIQDLRPIDILGYSKSVFADSHITTAVGKLPSTLSSAGNVDHSGQQRNPLYTNSGGLFGQVDPKSIYLPEPHGVNRSHNSCHPMPKMHDAIFHACFMISIQLHESHLKHIWTQAAKTGI